MTTITYNIVLSECLIYVIIRVWRVNTIWTCESKSRGKRRISDSRDSQDSQDSHGIPSPWKSSENTGSTMGILGVQWESREYGGNRIWRHPWVLMSHYIKVPLRPIIRRYSWVLMSYYMNVPLGPHALLYEGTLGSSCPNICRYPWVLMSHYMKVHLGLIVRRYRWVLMCYCLEIPLGPHVLLYEGTPGSSCAII